MPKEIYNEGRVVGMSAYEIYLRHQLSEYPEMEPVTEREWLASTIGAGCSMILRIPKDTPAGAFEKQLPDNSTLCAATNITATVFDGQVSLDATQTWATTALSFLIQLIHTLLLLEIQFHKVLHGQKVKGHILKST